MGLSERNTGTVCLKQLLHRLPESRSFVYHCFIDVADAVMSLEDVCLLNSLRSIHSCQ